MLKDTSLNQNQYIKAINLICQGEADRNVARQLGVTYGIIQRIREDLGIPNVYQRGSSPAIISNPSFKVIVINYLRNRCIQSINNGGLIYLTSRDLLQNFNYTKNRAWSVSKLSRYLTSRNFILKRHRIHKLGNIRINTKLMEYAFDPDFINSDLSDLI